MAASLGRKALWRTASYLSRIAANTAVVGRALWWPVVRTSRGFRWGLQRRVSPIPLALVLAVASLAAAWYIGETIWGYGQLLLAIGFFSSAYPTLIALHLKSANRLLPVELERLTVAHYYGMVTDAARWVLLVGAATWAYLQRWPDYAAGFPAKTGPVALGLVLTLPVSFGFAWQWMSRLAAPDGIRPDRAPFASWVAQPGNLFYNSLMLVGAAIAVSPSTGDFGRGAVEGLLLLMAVVLIGLSWGAWFFTFIVSDTGTVADVPEGGTAAT